MTLKVEYDPEADGAYVYLHADQSYEYASTRRLDAYRALDVAKDGTPIGVDFMVVSRGVDLRGLPRPAALAKALAAHNIPVRSAPPVAVSPVP